MGVYSVAVVACNLCVLHAWLDLRVHVTWHECHHVGQSLWRYWQESHFLRVSPDVYEQLHKITLGFNNSKIVEDVFKLLRDRERHHPSGMMSPLERWHKARTSRLILENDCQEVKVTETARSAAGAKVPASTHVAGDEGFSMGSNTLATLGGKADWPTLSPMAWRRVPCAWRCYRELGGDCRRSRRHGCRNSHNLVCCCIALMWRGTIKPPV